MLLAPFFRGLARHLFVSCIALTATTAALLAQINTPSANDGFDPAPDGNVYDLALQPNGQLVIAGQFANLTPNGGISIARNNIARVNPDGSLDGNFNPNADGAVRQIALQRDGKIIIVGDFTHVGGVARNLIARLNSDGSVDSTFSPGIGASIDPAILPVAPYIYAVVYNIADGTIYVGGTFGSVTSTGSTTPIERNNIVRFDSNGIVDPMYNPNANAAVMAMALHENGKLVVGGSFTQFNALGDAGPVQRLRIARLNTNGTVDSQFNTTVNDGVTSIVVQPDNKIVLCGYFETMQGIDDTAVANRSHIGRLNHDGRSVDTEFYPNVGGTAWRVALAPDGGILVGGRFTQAWGRGQTTASRPYAARFLPDGSLDQTFDLGLNGDVDAFAFRTDGSLVLGGYFTRFQPAASVSAVVRNHVARVMPTGALDTAFHLDPSGRILASVVQTDGNIVVAGSFTNIGGSNHYFLARVHPDGSVDTSYNPVFNDKVLALAYSPSENKVLVGGNFTTIGGEPRNHIARMNSIGTIDSEFNPNIDGPVSSIVLQTDGKILVGGRFNNVQPLNASASITRNNILRLNDDGTLDNNFDPNASFFITTIALQSDGKILIGGGFQSLMPNGATTATVRNYLARLNSDGTIDANYDPDPNNNVYAIVVQSDGNAVVGGRFTDFLPPGATAVTVRNRIARINADGSIDSAYDPNLNNTVLVLALQSSGDVLAGGNFTTAQPAGDSDWTLRKYFVQLTSAGKVDALNLDLNELAGNTVDSINVLKDNTLQNTAAAAPKDSFFLGGNFISLQPTGGATNAPSRVTRNHFALITNTGTLSPFDAGAGGSVTGQVKALAIEPSGQIVIGGNFSDIGGATSTNIARFDPTGPADAFFNSNLTADDVVNAVAIRPIDTSLPSQLGGFAWLNADGSRRDSFQGTLNIQGQIDFAYVQPADGKVIVGGGFTDFTNTTHGNLLRFNPDGTLDTSFSPQISGEVTVLVPQGSNYLIGGTFTQVNGTTRNYIARIDTNGNLDTTFDPNANARVDSIVAQSDGKIVFGGSFTTVQPNGASASTVRNYIARVNTDGTLDTAYDPHLNNIVNQMVIQSDNRVIAGGVFTQVQPNGATTATTQNYIARFNTDGTVDTTFNPNPNSAVESLALQPNGSILLGGAFTTLQPNGATTGTPRSRIARINNDGSLDPSFYPIPNSDVTTIGLGSDGSMLIVGNFNAIEPSGSSTPIARNHLARLTSTGGLESTFNPDFDGSLFSATYAPDGSILVAGSFATLQPSGTVIVGGRFNTIGGLPVPKLALLNSDGSVNSSFQPSPNGAINVTMASADGSFYVAGEFTQISGQPRTGLARYVVPDANKATVALDPGFVPASSGTVSSVALQSDRRLIVGTSNGVVRLNTDGSIDTSFSAKASFTPATALVIQPDGRILVAGSGSGQPLQRLLRLNSDGTVDSSFATVTFNSAVALQAVTLQTDGEIVVAGSFTNLGTDTSGAPISYLARLNSDGTVDRSYNPNPNGPVTAVALQSDGHMLIAGTFTTVGGVQEVGLARLASTGLPTQDVGVTPTGTVTWTMTGTSGLVEDVVFEESTDLQNWTSLGTATRVPGTAMWQLTTSLLTGIPGTFYIRALGITPGSAGVSTSVYQEVRWINLTTTASSSAAVVAPVVSTTSWDSAHFVWTQDSAGVMRVTDAQTGVVVDPSQTVLTSGPNHIGSSTAKMSNLSTRGNVSPAAPLIAGFAITGSGSRTVLVRAIGPGLIPFGVTDYLRVPQLVLVNNLSHTVVSTNTGWNNDPALGAMFAQTGAFPLQPGSADSALIATLSPGNYTVQVVDGGGNGSPGGEALVEIYDAGSLNDTSTRLVNLSGRGTILAGGTLTGGLYVSGTAPKTMLVRGVGPALAGFGVTGVLADPRISVYGGTNQLIATNDNWGVSDQTNFPDVDMAKLLSDAASAVGAFPFATGSKDAAVIVTLQPGAYTVQVTGVGGTGGAAMIEIYELP